MIQLTYILMMKGSSRYINSAIFGSVISNKGSFYADRPKQHLQQGSKILYYYSKTRKKYRRLTEPQQSTELLYTRLYYMEVQDGLSIVAFVERESTCRYTIFNLAQKKCSSVQQFYRIHRLHHT